MPTEVTDPDLLKQLEGQQEVTNPALLDRLSPGWKTYNDPSETDPNSPAYQAKYGPVSGNSFLQNTRIGVGKFYTDALLGARQMYAQTTGGDQQSVVDPITGQTAQQKRATDKPVAGTWGGTLGQIVGAAPLAALPGVNTYAGAGILGGALGAVQPTTENDSRLLNTGVGAGIGIASKYAGDTFSNWLTNRAKQPFLGWNQATGNEAAAQAVGSDAASLNQPAIADTGQRLGGIFRAARSPDVTIPVESNVESMVNGAAGKLNLSSRQALMGNQEVSDLLAHVANGSATAEQLGSISSNLGNQAAAEMSSKMGDRQLGKALFSIKENIDDLIGQSIQSPELKAAYEAARPQYRTFMTLTKRPTLLNSSTGDVNLRNLGNYLQRYDQGYSTGSNTSPLYEAARFGQASALGSRAPPPILQPGKWLKFHATNNSLVGAATGTIANVGAPVAPLIKSGLPSFGVSSVPVDLPYITQ